MSATFESRGATATASDPSFDGGSSFDVARPYRVTSEVFVAAVLVMQFGMLGYDLIGDQAFVWYGLCLWGSMLVVLAPVGSIMKLRISLSVMAFALWLSMSYFYAPNLDEWRRVVIRLAVLPTLLMFVMTIIGFDRMIIVLKKTVWVAIAATFISAAVIPSRTTRHVDLATGLEVLPGWHGLFDHKNGLMLFMVVGVVTFLSYETDRTRRTTMIALAFTLGVLSQSATALAVLLILMATSATLRHFQNQPSEHRSGFLAVMIVVWSIMATIVIMAAASIVALSGKDLTFSGRTKIWSAVIEAIRSEPLKGYGAGSVWINNSEPTVTIRRQVGFVAGNAHQGALELVLQLGLIGLVLYSLVLITVVGRAWMARHRSPASARWALLVVAAIVLWSLSESSTMGALFTIAALACVMPTDRDPLRLTVAEPDSDDDDPVPAPVLRSLRPLG